MKILYLPAYFEPELAASGYLVTNRNEAFAAEGFDMLVYTPIPTRGISKQTRKIYKERKEDYLYNGKMKVLRFPLMRERRNPLQRALRYLLAAFKQYWWASHSQEAKQCNVMLIASTPPIQGAMAALVKRWTHIPFVYNLQDIFPDSLVSTGLAKKDSLLWKIGRKIEDFTYRNADKIIVISKDFKRNIMTKGVPKEKIEVIYNWVDEQAVKEVKREDNLLFDRYGLDRNKFYVSYCGNIGLTQNMDMLLEVAKELETEKGIHFVLVGNGAYKEELEKKIAIRNIKNVTLLPFQPYEEISHVFSLGDVGLVISKPGVGENSVPSKTWSIMSASRPVLASFDENELKEIIEKYHCGYFTAAGNKESFKKAILSLYGDKAQCRQLGMNGRKFVMDNLTREIGTSKYVRVVQELVKATMNRTYDETL